MAPRPRRTESCLSFIVLALLALLAAAAHAADTTEHHALTLDVDKAQLITLPEPATTVFVANPEVADVQVPNQPNQSSFLVYGKKPGQTTILALTASGNAVGYAITVRRAVGDVAE